MITVSPSNPTSDNYIVLEAVVKIGCHQLPHLTITGNDIHIELVPYFSTDPCVATLPPFVSQWPLGRLAAGNYLVTADQYNSPSETQAFSVAQGDLPFPTPPIPTMGFVGVALLALALLWGTHKVLKRTSNRTA